MYYEPFDDNVKNLDEMDKCLERHNYSPFHRETPGPDGITSKFYQTIKGILNSFCKWCEGVTL